MDETKYLDLTLESDKEISFFIRLDSKNRVFKYRYNANEDYRPFLERIGDYIQDLALDYLVKGVADKVTAHEEENLLMYDIVIHHFQNYIWQLVGRYQINSVDVKQMICRCNLIDKAELIRLYREHGGVKKAMIRATNASMICGGCSFELNAQWSTLSSLEKASH